MRQEDRDRTRHATSDGSVLGDNDPKCLHVLFIVLFCCRDGGACVPTLACAMGRLRVCAQETRPTVG